MDNWQRQSLINILLSIGILAGATIDVMHAFKIA